MEKGEEKERNGAGMVVEKTDGGAKTAIAFDIERNENFFDLNTYKHQVNQFRLRKKQNNDPFAAENSPYAPLAPPYYPYTQPKVSGHAPSYKFGKAGPTSGGVNMTERYLRGCVDTGSSEEPRKGAVVRNYLYDDHKIRENKKIMMEAFDEVQKNKKANMPKASLESKKLALDRFNESLS